MEIHIEMLIFPKLDLHFFQSFDLFMFHFYFLTKHVFIDNFYISLLVAKIFFKEVVSTSSVAKITFVVTDIFFSFVDISL